MPDEKADLNQLFEIKVLTEGRIEKSIFSLIDGFGDSFTERSKSRHAISLRNLGSFQ